MNNIFNSELNISTKKFSISGNKIDNQIINNDRKKCQFFCIFNPNLLDFNIKIFDKDENLLHIFNINQFKSIFNMKDLNIKSYRLETDLNNQEIYILKFFSNTDYKNWQVDLINDNDEIQNQIEGYFGFIFSSSDLNINDKYIIKYDQLSKDILYKINMIDKDSTIFHIYSLEGTVLNSTIS